MSPWLAFDAYQFTRTNEQQKRLFNLIPRNDDGSTVLAVICFVVRGRQWSFERSTACQHLSTGARWDGGMRLMVMGSLR
jgi:hypothetical protein